MSNNGWPRLPHEKEASSPGPSRMMSFRERIMQRVAESQPPATSSQSSRPSTADAWSTQGGGVDVRDFGAPPPVPAKVPPPVPPKDPKYLQRAQTLALPDSPTNSRSRAMSTSSRPDTPTSQSSLRRAGAVRRQGLSIPTDDQGIPVRLTDGPMGKARAPWAGHEAFIPRTPQTPNRPGGTPRSGGQGDYFAQSPRHKKNDVGSPRTPGPISETRAQAPWALPSNFIPRPPGSAPPTPARLASFTERYRAHLRDQQKPSSPLSPRPPRSAGNYSRRPSGDPAPEDTLEALLNDRQRPRPVKVHTMPPERVRRNGRDGSPSRRGE
ncbi:hypothetical protein AAE478_010469 [Parahypoxylon ruwenzoriense]